MLFGWIAEWFGPEATGHCVLILHPVAFAGWVGLWITALNIFPIGQLDGGHVFYALLRRRSYFVVRLLILAIVVAIIAYGLYEWSLILILLFLMGPFHPPTANDDEPLGWPRIVLGCLTLAFLPLGFTPRPFV